MTTVNPRHISPLGDQRERAVRCQEPGCGAETWAIDARCDDHAIERPDDESIHRAIGWIFSALEREHPGFVTAQADLAEPDHPEIAAALRHLNRGIA